MKLTATDAPKMLQIENAIIQELKKQNALHPGIEAMIGVVALVRIARQLLNQYDAKTQAQHLSSLLVHLQGNTTNDELNPLIVIPSHFGLVGGNGGH